MVHSILSEEEIEELCDVLNDPAEQENLENIDKMQTIQNGISRLINNYIDEYVKFPKLDKLISIYEEIFTKNFNNIVDNSKVYWFCNDMVKCIQSKYSLGMNIDHDNKKIEVKIDYCPY